jgi:enamine deaminase RidA (YjgF/YER057c/UK114 family)
MTDEARVILTRASPRLPAANNHPLSNGPSYEPRKPVMNTPQHHNVQRLSSGSTFERDVAYCRVVAVGSQVFVAGTTGYNYKTMTIEPGVEAQTRQCLANISEALARVGAVMADVVRVTYILQDAAEFPLTWPLLREAFGAAPPVATMIVAGLSSPIMRIEIQVDAIIGAGGARSTT